MEQFRIVNNDKEQYCNNLFNGTSLICLAELNWINTKLFLFLYSIIFSLSYC